MGGFDVKDLLTFDKMIATKVMKLIYFVGLVGIVGFDLVSFVRSSFVMPTSFLRDLARSSLLSSAPHSASLQHGRAAYAWRERGRDQAPCPTSSR